MLGPTHLFQDVVPKYSLLKAYRSVLNLTHVGRILNDSLGSLAIVKSGWIHPLERCSDAKESYAIVPTCELFAVPDRKCQ